MGYRNDNDRDRAARAIQTLALIVILLVIMLAVTQLQAQDCSDCLAAHQATSCSAACDSGNPAGGRLYGGGGGDEEDGSYGRLGSEHFAGHGR